MREFTELQGYIGAEYARRAGEPEEVAAAIEEQYLPDSAGGSLPATSAGPVTFQPEPFRASKARLSSRRIC